MNASASSSAVPGGGARPACPAFLLRIFGALAIASAVLFVAWPALRGGWVWDDLSEITLNPTLRDPAGLRRIWLHPPGPDYFPLKSTAQWLEWRLWGDRPLGFHLATAALHAVGALLVWRVLGRLGLRAAWLGGLVFAVHPMAAESLAWISEQKNTLSLPLVLLSADAWLAYDQGRGRRFHALALAAFVAALLAKTSVAMFPAVLLLHAWWKRGRISRRALAASAPFFAASLVLGLVTVWFQRHGAIGAEPLDAGSPAARLARAGLALAFYLGKALAPVGLMPLYPRWRVDPPSAAQFLPWAGLGLLAFLLWRRRDGWGRPALFGLGYFVLNLLPVLGFVPMAFMRLSWVSDHFAYVSLVAVAGLAAAGAGALWARLGGAARPAALGLGAVGLGGLMLSARAHAAPFRGGEALWSYAAAANPGSAAARYNLANARLAAGRPAEAAPEFEAALGLEPGFAEARSNYGDALLRLGRSEEAERQYRAALADDPRLALTRDKLGDLLLARGRLDEALAQYQAAAAVRPDSAAVQADLAYALARAGRLEEAAARYGAALEREPGDAENWDELGTVLALLGRPAEAVAGYRRALALRPADAEAHNNLGLVLARLGRPGEALPEFETALRLRPDFAQARDNLERLRRGEMP